MQKILPAAGRLLRRYYWKNCLSR